MHLSAYAYTFSKVYILNVNAITFFREIQNNMTVQTGFPGAYILLFSTVFIQLQVMTQFIFEDVFAVISSVFIEPLYKGAVRCRDFSI